MKFEVAAPDKWESSGMSLFSHRQRAEPQGQDSLTIRPTWLVTWPALALNQKLTENFLPRASSP